MKKKTFWMNMDILFLNRKWTPMFYKYVEEQPQALANLAALKPQWSIPLFREVPLILSWVMDNGF